MSLAFASQLQVDNLPDEQLNDQFEVIMPSLYLDGSDKKERGFFGKVFASASGLKYSPVVEEITFNSKTFKTDTRRVRTGWFNVPSDIENYKDVSITMFCPNSMLTQYYLEAWRNMIYNKEGEYYYPASNYKKNIEIYIYGAGGSTMSGLTYSMHYTLKGCFPYQQSDFKFVYSDNPKRLTITANFKVDAVVVDSSSLTRSLITNAITNPTSILDNVISGISNSSAYTLEDTYGDTVDKSLVNSITDKAKDVAGIK